MDWLSVWTWYVNIFFMEFLAFTLVWKSSFYTKREQKIGVSKRKRMLTKNLLALFGLILHFVKRIFFRIAETSRALLRCRTLGFNREIDFLKEKNRATLGISFGKNFYTQRVFPLFSFSERNNYNLIWRRLCGLHRKPNRKPVKTCCKCDGNKSD